MVHIWEILLIYRVAKHKAVVDKGETVWMVRESVMTNIICKNRLESNFHWKIHTAQKACNIAPDGFSQIENRKFETIPVILITRLHSKKSVKMTKIRCQIQISPLCFCHAAKWYKVYTSRKNRLWMEQYGSYERNTVEITGGSFRAVQNLDLFKPVRGRDQEL